MVRTEKSGLTVMITGKRIVVWDSKANKIGQIVVNSYAWQRKGNYGTFGII